MKKVISVLTVIIMLIMLSGCSLLNEQQKSDSYVSQNSQTTNQETQIEVQEPETVTLTPENVDNYLTFLLSAKDIELYDWEYDSSINTGHGKLSVKIQPKKRGTFDGVVLNVTLVTAAQGWVAPDSWEERKKELVVSLDGEFEDEYKINARLSSDWISDTPKFELKINSVSGTFTAN